MSRNLFEWATELYGNGPQIIKSSEECGELVQAVAKYLLATHPERHPHTDYDPHEMALDVIRESVQVQIMIDQLKVVFNDPAYWTVIKEEELDRLRVRLERDDFTFQGGM